MTTDQRNLIKRELTKAYYSDDDILYLALCEITANSSECTDDDWEDIEAHCFTLQRGDTPKQ